MPRRWVTATRCSLACEFCYQAPIRDAGNQAGADYDMDAMKRALEAAGYHFTVFGGEPFGWSTAVGTLLILAGVALAR